MSDLFPGIKEEEVDYGTLLEALKAASVALQIEPVDLVNNAVDIIAKRRALCFNLGMIGDEVLNRRPHLHLRVGDCRSKSFSGLVAVRASAPRAPQVL